MHYQGSYFIYQQSQSLQNFSSPQNSASFDHRKLQVDRRHYETFSISGRRAGNSGFRCQVLGTFWAAFTDEGEGAGLHLLCVE